MPVIPALGRQRQANHCEFKASLVSKESFKTARADTQRNSVSKNKQKTKKKETRNEVQVSGLPYT